MNRSSLTTLLCLWDQRINLSYRSGIQTRQNVFEPLAKADGVEFKRGRTSSSHLRKQMPFALHVAANEYRIARPWSPASLPELTGSVRDGFDAPIEAVTLKKEKLFICAKLRENGLKDF